MLVPAASTATTCVSSDPLAGSEAYDQQVETNTWQAENTLVAGNQVTLIDWGDAIESTDFNSKMQRIETSLYASLAEPMTGYTMCKTNDLTGVGELWGAVGGSDQGLTALPSNDAMVYTAGARLTIQRVVPDRTYTWDTSAHRWVGCGADAPVFNQAVHESAGDGPGTYGVEVTVSGKITYGLVLRTDSLPTGEYRLTFSLDGATDGFPGSGTSLATASILVPEESTLETLAAAAAQEESGGAPGANTAVMRNDLNLTYIDVGLGTRTDPVPDSCTVAPPATGGGGSAPAAEVPAAAAPAAETPAEVTPTAIANPEAATALIAQHAKITVKKSGRYPVGKVIVLAKRPIKTDAGVTVRWRATKASQDNCLVQVRKGKATATLIKPGRCTVIGWAPAPSPAYAPFKVTRTYRVIR
ncbi:MAG: hypothetical protein GC156_13150 [Actinomycetales bacterium]|nr:hypothetical protein [Actinomycetales bacterium]